MLACDEAEPARRVAIEAKFEKSGRNRKTENLGLVVLQRDQRFQSVPLTVKREIASRLGILAEFKTNAFDAVMTPAPAAQITALTLDSVFSELHLVEMKTTRKPIADDGLGGFFFGATKREYDLAKLLGDRYLFAFVVLNTQNVYGREFFVLLTYDELMARTRNQRVQYQVNLVREWKGGPSRFGGGPNLGG